ncbi:uncharacterized protein LOC113002644 [Solenopsis invicta]|uniref:uncharacterized protein LOC113002644 n=1 Tax=Solenopsis invicta TaxID=13686 RepID=UPI000E33E0EE|nr:uncharacterized protein LOC113002644 [Solenopsis invicta]
MFAAFFAFVFITTTYAANDLPSYIRLCGRNSPNDVYGQCMKANIDNVKSTICSKGLPEFNVPPSQPITIDKIVIYDTNNLKLSVEDVKLTDFCDFEITSNNVSSDKLRFEFALKYDRIVMDGTYNFDIQLLVSLANKGLFHVTTNDATATMDVELKEVTKNGKTEIYASKVKTKLNIKNFVFEFNDKEDNLAQLHEVLSQTINNNSKEIISKLNPSFEQAISKLLMSVLKKVFYNRFEQLFPNDA